jgi:hypothetical protein
VEKIENLLEERHHDYGDFGKGIRVEAQMMQLLNTLHKDHHGIGLSNRHQSYLFRILIKLSRLGVSPDHLDSWKDIEGYSHLIHNDILEEYDAKEIKV